MKRPACLEWKSLSQRPPRAFASESKNRCHFVLDRDLLEREPSPRITAPPADRLSSPLIALTRRSVRLPLVREYACHLPMSANLGECPERKVATSQRRRERKHARSHPAPGSFVAAFTALSRFSHRLSPIRGRGHSGTNPATGRNRRMRYATVLHSGDREVERSRAPTSLAMNLISINCVGSERRGVTTIVLDTAGLDDP